MLTNCANPKCKEPFKFLGEGRLFLDNPTDALDLTQQQLFERCSWLCARCAKQYELRFQEGRPLLVPRSLRRAASL
jgi:hypothetical protein